STLPLVSPLSLPAGRGPAAPKKSRLAARAANRKRGQQVRCIADSSRKSKGEIAGVDPATGRRITWARARRKHSSSNKQGRLDGQAGTEAQREARPACALAAQLIENEQDRWRR